MSINRIWNGYWMTYAYAPRPPKGRPESAEQIDFASWCRYHYPEDAALCLHPVNEGHMTAAYRIDLIKQGMLKGASDWIMLFSGARFPAGVIELKRENGGTLSRDKMLFLYRASRDGKFAAAAFGCECAKLAFLDYKKGFDNEALAAIIIKPLRNAAAKLSLNEELS